MAAKPISLEGRTVLLSASVPNPWRSPLYYRATAGVEVQLAVGAFIKTMLRSQATLAMGCHPSIAATSLQAAKDVNAARRRSKPVFIIYQSEFFLKNIVSSATYGLIYCEWASLTWTPRAESDRPAAANDRLRPGMAAKSLRLMREQMLIETRPAATVCIGGMEGVEEEVHLYRSILPGRPVYFLPGPGGASGHLAEWLPNSLPRLNRSNGAVNYEELFNGLAVDIERRTS